MRLKLAVAALVAVGAGGCYVVATDHGVAVGVNLRPIYSPIASTGIQVVTNASGDVFYYGGVYYRWWGGRWWRSPAWTSGWTPITVVPRVFLSIPQTHPKFHVVRYHPDHPSHPVHPTHPATPAHPVHPTHPAVRANVRSEVREAVKESAGPGRPVGPPDAEKEKKEKEKGGRKGGR